MLSYSGLAVTIQPDWATVSLAEAKAHLRVGDSTDDDAYINALIEAATAKLEGEYGVAFNTQTWAMTLDTFPLGSESIRLPIAPVTAITSITYTDAAGATQTWASSNYVLTSSMRPARISLAFGCYYPSTYGQVDAVTVTFVAGAADNAIPADLKQAVLIYLAHLYEFREPLISGTIVAQIPDLVDGLMQKHRAWVF